MKSAEGWGKKKFLFYIISPTYSALFISGTLFPIIDNEEKDPVWYAVAALFFFTFLIVAPAIWPRLLTWTSIANLSISEEGFKSTSVNMMYVFLALVSTLLVILLSTMKSGVGPGVLGYVAALVAPILCVLWSLREIFLSKGGKSILLIDEMGVTFYQGSRIYSLVPGTGTVSSLGTLADVLNYFKLDGRWNVVKKKLLSNQMEETMYKSVHLGPHLIGRTCRDDIVYLLKKYEALDVNSETQN